MDSELHGELADSVAAMNVAVTGAPTTSRLSGRKMSLQEKGSRIARQPTIETKRVSITDADVRRL